MYTDESKLASILDQAFSAFVSDQEDLQRNIDELKEKSFFEDDNRSEINEELEKLEVRSSSIFFTCVAVFILKIERERELSDLEHRYKFLRLIWSNHTVSLPEEGGDDKNASETVES